MPSSACKKKKKDRLALHRNVHASGAVYRASNVGAIDECWRWSNPCQPDARDRFHRRGFFFNDPATTEIYTLSLHDALPISYHCGSVWPHDNAIIAAGLMRYGF